MAEGMEMYDFGQGETGLLARIQQDDFTRRNQQPKTPPEPTLTTQEFLLTDGSSAAAIIVTWAPTRKDMDYIIRWKKSTDSGYTYERSKTSPHIIRPVETGVTINVGLAAERRQYGTRSQFAGDVTIAAAGDTTPPAGAITLSLTVNDITGAIHLTWTTSTSADVTHYEVVRDTSSPAVTSYKQVGGTSDTDFNVVVGTTYFYRVRAVDRTGNQGAFSNEVSGTVAYVGVVTVSPTVACITDPGAAYTTAVTQKATIPAGTRFISLAVQVNSVSLVGGSGDITVRFSIGSSGSNTSSEQTLNFTSVSTQTVVLKSASPVSVSGSQNLLYEWKDAEGDTSTYQLTSAGSLQLTNS